MEETAPKLDFQASGAPTSAEGASIDAKNLNYHELNERILKSLMEGAKEVILRNVMGHRYIGINLQREEFLGSKVTIYGYPGNCLANFNNGLEFVVFGNAADDVGDTMHAGRVAIHGDARDVVGQALQGGEIFVRGNIGNRAGIQIREYERRKPFLVVGGSADDYLGEYMAGGIAIVLGIGASDREATRLVGRFVGTGMVGGKIFIRSRARSDTIGLPPQRKDVINYLDSLRLDGALNASEHDMIVAQRSANYHLLKRRLQPSVFRKVEKFFVSKYTRPPATDYRALNSDEGKELEPKLLEFTECFGFDKPTYEEWIASRFTIVEPECTTKPPERAIDEIAED